ncbi:endochitinase [Obelidium mucronatum]|nr:endochitinase [Obelidium mucronatum]
MPRLPQKGPPKRRQQKSQPRLLKQRRKRQRKQLQPKRRRQPQNQRKQPLLPPPPPPPGGIPTTLAQHRAYAASKSTSSVLKQLKHSTRTNPTNIDKITPGNPSNPENVKRVEKILTPAKWKYYFSMADPAYTYTNFLKSVAFFSGFCDTYPGKDSDTICKKLLATMFAHFAQETGAHDKKSSIPEWRQSLVYLREISCTETNTISGCFYNGDCTNPVFNTVFTCGKGSSNGFKAYFGRGAHQLSYSFNYGPFSEVMFNGDPTVLLNKPELVADTWLNLASAIFFFIYPQPPKPSMLWVMDGTYVPNAADLSAGRVNDFPSTIQIINGECAGSSTSNAAQNRINYYTAFMKDMGLDTKSSVLKCAGMGAFDSSSSAGKTEMYWVADYSGKPVCQLVPYQTNFNALMDGVGFDQYVKVCGNVF